MSLLPRNVLQAAEADLMRRIRNKGGLPNLPRGVAFELYAFHRDHVRKAKTIEQLLTHALMHPQLGLASHKRNTRVLYSDAVLLVKALQLLKVEYSGEVQAAATEEFV